MAHLDTKCPFCHKQSYTKSVTTSTLFGGSTKTLLSCGHVILKRNVKEVAFVQRDATFEKLFPFQKEGVEFCEKSGFKCLIADEMGLGKTVQALVTLRYHPELYPVLYVVKSAVKYQWQAQIKTWLVNDADPFANKAQVIDSAHDIIFPLNHTIISMDMLEKFKDKIIERGFKAIVIDESQNFKARMAQRTSALFELIEQCDFQARICLTGTPILNRASEFWTTLHLLRPEQWRAYDNFIWYWCDRNAKGTNVGGLLSWKRDEFHERTKHYVIRREKREVMKDLPKFSQRYEWIKIEDERIRDAYNNQLKELQKHLNKMDKLKKDATEQIALLGYLEKLRQLCALSKIPWVLEYIESFLLLEEDEKILIGLHHEIAIEALEEALHRQGYQTIRITGKDSAREKFDKVQEFQTNPKKRILLASMLAAGEGLDGLQKVCSTALTLERQWNLAKEKQFEARIDRYGQTKPVTNTFLLAKGTVDEYFTEIVLEKENYVISATSTKDIEEEMEKHFKSLNYVELAEKCVRNYI